jgi:hypothetical protein
MVNKFCTASIRFPIESRKIQFSGKTGWSGFRSMCSATICSTEPSLVKPDALVSETRVSEISRISDESSEMMTVDPDN